MRQRHDTLARLCARALAAGATRHSLSHFEWDVSDDCEASVVRELYARPEPDKAPDQRSRKAKRFAEAVRKAFPGAYLSSPLPQDRKGQRKSIEVCGISTKIPLRLTMHVRCRKCDKCMRKRGQMWYRRAINEVMAANRTWFGTITFSPEAQFAALARARQHCTRRGVVWEHLTPDEQFAALDRQHAAQLQLWLKRVRKEVVFDYQHDDYTIPRYCNRKTRKEYGPTLFVPNGRKAPKGFMRFILVCEAHKSGLPHYHILVHQVSEEVPVRHAVLSSQWTMGFTNFKLVKNPKHGAAYPCKYISKSALVRVRNSARYGQTFSNIDLPIVMAKKPMTPKGEA